MRCLSWLDLLLPWGVPSVLSSINLFLPWVRPQILLCVLTKNWGRVLYSSPYLLSVLPISLSLYHWAKWLVIVRIQNLFSFCSNLLKEIYSDHCNNMYNGYLCNHKIGNLQKPLRVNNIIYEVKIKVHLHVHLKVSLLQMHQVHSSESYFKL